MAQLALVVQVVQYAYMAYSIYSMATAKPTQVQGQKQELMDLKITSTEYGQPIPYVFGTVGIAGQIWWNTDRRPTTTTTVTESDGKGGSGTETSSSTITYDMDMLIGLSDNEIVGVARIWDNGKLIYTADNDATAESLEASAEAPKWTRMTVYTGSMSQLPDPTYEAAVGTANAPAYRGRGYVFIQGLQLGQGGQVPNLTFEVVASGTSSTGYLSNAPFATFDPANHGPEIVLSDENLTITHTASLDQAAVATVPFQNTGQWYCEFTINNVGTEVRVGIADATYNPNTGASGANFYYGYNKTGVVHYSALDTYLGWGTYTTGDVISMLYDADADTLHFWKNGVPSAHAAQAIVARAYAPMVEMYGSGASVTVNFGASAWAYEPTRWFTGWGTQTGFPVVATASPDVDDVVSALNLRAGLTAGQIDVTGLSTITRTVKSLAIAQIASTRQALELLMATYFFEMVVSDKIYFRPRGGASVVTIPYLDLGASMGDDQPEPLALRQMNELEIPAQIALTYINISDDYQNDTQYSDRLISADDGTVSAVQMAIGMTPSEAKSVADTMLLDQAASVIGTNIALLGDYCRLEPTDPVTVTDANGATFRLRLVKKTDSYPLIGFEAVLDDVSVLTSQGITSADYTSSTVVLPAVNTLMELMDIPILQDADNDAGFYGATKGDGTPYSGSAIFNSINNVDYVRKATVLESAVFGTCTTTLGNWTGPRVFDEQSSVTVDVGEGTLASTTRDAVLGSLSINAMMIGSELIQFVTATLGAAGIYTLTRLLRGGRGTEWAMTGHAASERCVLLRTAGLRRVPMQNNELGISYYYKGVTLGRSLSSATAEQFTDNGVGLKPFSPFDLRASRDGSGNITFTWQRRTRLVVRMIGALGISVPLGEELESYEIVLYSDATYTTEVVTIEALTTTAPYTAADQTIDFGSPQAVVYARVYQMSDVVGKGYALEQAA